jgi:hypothetical protein
LWSAIAAELQTGRTAVHVKNRWTKHLWKAHSLSEFGIDEREDQSATLLQNQVPVVEHPDMPDHTPFAALSSHAGLMDRIFDRFGEEGDESQIHFGDDDVGAV